MPSSSSRPGGRSRSDSRSPSPGRTAWTTYAVNSDDGFGEQFTAYLAVGVQLAGSSDGPTLFLRVPMDGDANDVLDLSAGVSVLF
jgi:hypothetical protein